MAVAGKCLFVALISVLVLVCVCEAAYDDSYNNNNGGYFPYKNYYEYGGYGYGYKKSPPPPAPKRRSKPKPKPSPSPKPSGNSMAAQFMMSQNAARANVGLKPLVWDSKLQAYAQNWANLRAQYGNCYLQHSNGPYGENIFWGSGKSWSPSEAAEAWVEEKQYYNYGSNSCQAGQQCGHYTQIVWRDSQRIGCARVTCSSGDVFMTCSYDPPGNYIGEKPY